MTEPFTANERTAVTLIAIVAFSVAAGVLTNWWVGVAAAAFAVGTACVLALIGDARNRRRP